MSNPKRIMITLQPEWEPMLKRLKQEQFKDVTQTQMLRHIIELGLESAKSEQPVRHDTGRESI